MNVRVSFPGVMFDGGFVTDGVVAKDNSKGVAVAFNKLTGTRLSAYEHGMPERLLSGVVTRSDPMLAMIDTRTSLALFDTLVFPGYLVWVTLNWKVRRAELGDLRLSACALGAIGIVQVTVNGLFAPGHWGLLVSVGSAVFGLAVLFFSGRVWRVATTTLVLSYVFGFVVVSGWQLIEDKFLYGSLVGLALLVADSMFWVGWLCWEGRASPSRPCNDRGPHL
jgi:hypothetical protein